MSLVSPANYLGEERKYVSTNKSYLTSSPNNPDHAPSGYDTSDENTAVSTKTTTTKTTTVTSATYVDMNDTSDTSKKKNQLSQEAIYRTKLKYGIFDSPAKHSSGIADNKLAAQTAAYLTTTKILPELSGQRSTSPEPSSLPPSIAPDAQAAANKLVMSTLRPEDMNLPHYLSKSSDRSSKPDITSHTAALKALSRDKSIIENAHLQASPVSSSHSHTALGKTPSKTITKEHPTQISRKLNLSQVLKGAERRANERITQRWDPTADKIERIKQSEKNYAVAVASYLTNKSSMEEQTKLKNMELQRLKHQSDVGDSYKVFNMAQVKTNMKLNSIDLAQKEVQLFNNEEFNRLAITKATDEYKKGQLGRVKTLKGQEGKVNLGGGLWVPWENVDKLAHERTDPVLKNVHETVAREKKTTLDIKDRYKQNRLDWENWKTFQRVKDEHDQLVFEKTAARNQDEKARLERDSKIKYNTMLAQMEDQINVKNEELNTAKTVHGSILATSNQELKNQTVNGMNDLQTWFHSSDQRNEIHKMNQEQDLLLKPYYDDMKEVESLNEKLIEQCNDAAKKIDILEKEIDVHRLNLNHIAVSIEEEHQHHIVNRGNIDILLARKTKEQSSIDEKQATIEKMKLDTLLIDKKIEENEKELALAAERLNMVEALRKNAQVEEDTAEENIKEILAYDPKIFATLPTAEEYEAKADELEAEEREKLASEEENTEQEQEQEQEATPVQQDEINDQGNLKEESVALNNYGGGATPTASARSVTNVSGVIVENTPATVDKPITKSNTIASSKPKDISRSNRVMNNGPSTSSGAKTSNWRDNFFMGSAERKKSQRVKRQQAQQQQQQKQQQPMANKKLGSITDNANVNKRGSPLATAPPIVAEEVAAGHKASTGNSQEGDLVASFTGFSQGSSPELVDANGQQGDQKNTNSLFKEVF
ncbi:uncharacterized protein NDAI_0C00600 [Naumovozyma dairenensis CBS 421]|uniref:Eisosome protein 1 n=1 Tax=Naumovozyma dairenensis (strain ATCC 10597 / BCRC 20456 / CBS 421 / NBRC 0211 / NRRL Y-12639) TaxID=1071378 RepID=G0W7G0_NAUDC|nr:hypothetical protein NDAI_0C00600 [Naumovozyma dairenensis CBS 421]CCD23721.1 hypothetical protein NDAI_0C00600 [Naumovozyma dairenensis CBS 421]